MEKQTIKQNNNNNKNEQKGNFIILNPKLLKDKTCLF